VACIRDFASITNFVVVRLRKENADRLREIKTVR